jgi:hypothetical protein
VPLSRHRQLRGDIPALDLATPHQNMLDADSAATGETSRSRPKRANKKSQRLFRETPAAVQRLFGSQRTCGGFSTDVLR